jgi:nucleotide-binding universal stress UspA family protein
MAQQQVIGHLADRRPAAVRVPADHEQQLMLRQAVAYDGGEESKAALGTEQTLARRLGARLVLSGAVDPRPYGPTLSETRAQADATARQQAQRVLTEAVEGLGGDCLSRAGSPWGPLSRRSCRPLRTMLLVMGSRGYGPVRSVLVGSVSWRVIAHASCPVIVVPRGARTDL